MNLERAKGPHWSEQPPERFRAFRSGLLEIEEGVYLEHGTKLTAPSVRYQADLVRRALEQPERVGPLLGELTPPRGLEQVKSNVRGRGSRRIVQQMFEAALQSGFVTLSRVDFYTRAFGPIEGNPVWFVYSHIFNAPHELVAHCEPEAGATVRAFLEQLQKKRNAPGKPVAAHRAAACV